MKEMRRIVLIILFFSLYFILNYRLTFAAPSCQSGGMQASFSLSPYSDWRAENLKITTSSLPNHVQRVKIRLGGYPSSKPFVSPEMTVINNGVDYTFSNLSLPDLFYPVMEIPITLVNSSTGKESDFCEVGILKLEPINCISGSLGHSSAGPKQSMRIYGTLNMPNWPIQIIYKLFQVKGNGRADSKGNFDIAITGFDDFGTYTLEIIDAKSPSGRRLCTIDITVRADLQPTVPPGVTLKPTGGLTPKGPCDKGSSEYNDCNACVEGTGKYVGKPGVWTALGCMPTGPEQFIAWLLPKVIGIAGGIAFLLILWGAFMVLTSAGNPEKLNEGKDIIVSAIVGLIVILFSVVLLRIIGVDILGIPGIQ